MDVAQWYVRQEISKVESAARSAKVRVEHARTLREVVQQGQISIPPHLRALRHTMLELKQLATAQEKRADEIVQQQLERLIKIVKNTTLSPEERHQELKRRYGTLMTKEWVYLRGGFPAVLSRATREADKLLYLSRQEAAT